MRAKTKTLVFMKRFVFFLFTLLFIGVGIEAKTVPAYLDVGLSEFVLDDCSEGITIGETMAMLDLDFYIFQAGFGSQLVSAEDGEDRLLPFLANQTEGAFYNNLIVVRHNDDTRFLSLRLGKTRQGYSESINYRGFGFGQINKWPIASNLTYFGKIS